MSKTVPLLVHQSKEDGKSMCRRPETAPGLLQCHSRVMLWWVISQVASSAPKADTSASTVDIDSTWRAFIDSGLKIYVCLYLHANTMWPVIVELWSSFNIFIIPGLT